MPVQVSYPGVYVQEVPSGVRTITGVSTSIGAFIGRTAMGSLNKATRCLSYSDFLRNFSGPHPYSDLAASVKQFFDNGGTDCYVVRIAHNASKAAVTLRRQAAAPANADNVLTATAKDAGAWGNGISLLVDYNTPAPDETFNLTVFYEEKGVLKASETHSNLSMDSTSPRFAPSFVSQSSALIDLALAAGANLNNSALAGYSESRRVLGSANVAALRTTLNNMIYPADPTTAQCRFAMSVNGSQYIDIDLSKVNGNLVGVAFNDLLVEIEARINPQLGDAVPGLAVTASWQTVGGAARRVLRLSANSGNNHSVRIRKAQSRDFAAPMMLGIDQGGVEAVRFSNWRPAPNATLLDGDINVLASQTQSAFDAVTVAGTAVLMTGALVTTIGTDLWYQDGLASALTGHSDGVREKLTILAKKINAAPTLKVKAEVWGYHLALKPLDGTINQTTTFATGVAAVDALFTGNTRRYALGTTGSGSYSTNGTVGKDDDGNPLTVADYLGNEADQTGIYALDAVDLFNLLVIPTDTDIDENEYLQIATESATYCKNNRAFLILDAPASWTVNGRPTADASDVNNLRTFVENDYTALYYPRVQYSDRGLTKTMGVSGMMAGLYARTDAEVGVWKAPAGMDATLTGAIGLEVVLTDRENGVLNKLGVNCLRRQPSGNVSWGARTLDGSDDLGSEWKYVPIRRLALFIEESLYRGTKWAVFEPNDEPLWAKIRLNVGAFMQRLFRQGAFQGSSPDQAFYVKCDSETTTQGDRNLGIVNIQVGFAPLKPAEFVVISIQQMAGDL